MIPVLRELSPGLQGYTNAIAPSERVREEAVVVGSERELQARFYGGEFGLHWPSTEGDQIELLDPGFWNHEPGPDFIGATIRINGGAPLRGDIELDGEVLDWERHGHAINPAFSRVILHVFFHRSSRTTFTRTVEHRQVPQVQLTTGGVQTFPRIVRADPLSVEAALPLIELAAQFRFHEKSQRLRRAVILHGWPAALDQTLARTLGYKRNSTPFLLLAQRCEARNENPQITEARLFGTAGFLRAEDFESAPLATRQYLRRLWDDWWELREANSRLILPAEAWSLAGIRPGNHPHRRIGAWIAARQKAAIWGEAFQKGEEAGVHAVLSELHHPFWESHWNLHGKSLPGSKRVALLGAERLSDFLVNGLYPWAVSEGKVSWETFQQVRVPAIPEKIAATAQWLTPELPLAQLRLAWIQQGLLQLDADVRGWKSPQEFKESLVR